MTSKVSEKSKLELISALSDIKQQAKEKENNIELDVGNDFEKKLRLYSQFLNNQQIRQKQFNTPQPQSKQQEDTEPNPLKRQMKKVMQKMVKFQNNLTDYEIKYNFSTTIK